MILIDQRQEVIQVDEALMETIKKVIEVALREEKVLRPYEVSVLLVDNKEIARINMETRGIDKETDVLSFPMLDYPQGKVFKDTYVDYSFDATFLDGQDLVLGDIVLSLEKAKEQSEDFNHSFTREASYLVVHSVLHLLGYDHMKDEEKALMREREEAILAMLNISR